MGFLAQIGIWLLGLWANPTVQEIVKETITDLVDVGQDVLELAMEAVNEAGAKTDLDTAGKFEYAFGKLTAAFPGIGKSLANRIIENAYGALKKR